MKITFRQIDAFQTLISCGTVTKTASLLEISQPAVSRLISDLEKGAGFKLFNKVFRHFEAPWAFFKLWESLHCPTGLSNCFQSLF